MKRSYFVATSGNLARKKNRLSMNAFLIATTLKSVRASCSQSASLTFAARLIVDPPPFPGRGSSPVGGGPCKTHPSPDDDGGALGEERGARPPPERAREALSVDTRHVDVEDGIGHRPDPPRRMLDLVLGRRALRVAGVAPVVLGDELRLRARLRERGLARGRDREPVPALAGAPRVLDAAAARADIARVAHGERLVALAVDPPRDGRDREARH